MMLHYLIDKMATSKWSILINAGTRNLILSRFCQYFFIGQRTQAYSTAVVPQMNETNQKINIPLYRCLESDPTKHTLNHEAMFYEVSEEDRKRFFPDYAFRKLHLRQIQVFRETMWMIRRPALEIIHYLKTANYSHPVIRYVIYGRKGFGKSMILNHVTHYCAVNNWLLVHIPNMNKLLYCIKEIQTSSYNPSRIDVPLESADWLKLFKQQNLPLLQEKQFKTTKKYIWNKRECLEEGSSWEELIEHGVNRVKYASDCIGALLREIRLQAETGIRTLVSIQAANVFFQESKIKDENKNLVHARNISIVHAFRKIMNLKWRNGAVVVTLDPQLKCFSMENVYMPRALLQKEGFEVLDPFVPIHVDKYSEKEMLSCFDFYIDKRLLQTEKAKTEPGKKELMFISGGNAYTLSYLCSIY